MELDWKAKQSNGFIEMDWKVLGLEVRGKQSNGEVSWKLNAVAVGKISSILKG